MLALTGVTDVSRACGNLSQNCIPYIPRSRIPPKFGVFEPFAARYAFNWRALQHVLPNAPASSLFFANFLNFRGRSRKKDYNFAHR